LGLPKLETDFFLLLVQIERASTQDLKKYFREKRDEIKRESLKISRLVLPSQEMDDVEKAVFYSSPLYSAIHLYTSISKGKSLDQIVKRFSLTVERAKAILQFLVDCGLCRFADGLYIMYQPSTHVSRQSPFLTKHHSNWRIAAIQKSENVSQEEFMFTANISISHEDFKVIRETLADAVRNLAKKVEKSEAEEIANINIDLFWV
jgi:hypothetical protein